MTGPVVTGFSRRSGRGRSTLHAAVSADGRVRVRKSHARRGRFAIVEHEVDEAVAQIKSSRLTEALGLASRTSKAAQR